MHIIHRYSRMYRRGVFFSCVTSISHGGNFLYWYLYMSNNRSKHLIRSNTVFRHVCCLFTDMFLKVSIEKVYFACLLVTVRSKRSDNRSPLPAKSSINKKLLFWF